ncbi:hypothetical protein [Streptomyces prasinopilosus]|uniref:hypothetical protein n=1 Tax=Streptomyces prasinopilosus TaxID=67344 RepID=UPI0006EB72E4|nr:hypothetical protein [Streptomyces prasinopilosus]
MSDPTMRAFLDSVIGAAVGLGLFAAILLPAGDDLSWTRFLIGCAILLVTPATVTLLLGRHRHR